MSKTYIALMAIEAADANGAAISIEPRSAQHSGLFSHEFDAATEKRLLDLGAIRKPEGTEQYEKLTQIETLAERAPIEATATEVGKPAAVTEKPIKVPKKTVEPELLG